MSVKIIIMDRKITSAAALLGMIAIILGAFGAHALKNYLSADQLAAYETGVKYQMYHSLFLLFIGLNGHLQEKTRIIIFQLAIWGVFLFSGSIYLLTTKPLTGMDFKGIGFLTPVGGTLLIASWGFLLWSFLKRRG